MTSTDSSAPASTQLAGARTGPARLVVLVILLSNLGWALLLPWLLTRPPTLGAKVLVAGLLLVAGGLLAAVLWAAVTPAVGPRRRARVLAALAAVAMVAWLPAYSWAEPGEEPWAWLAAFVAGSAPLVVPWSRSLLLAVGLSAAAVVGAWWADQSPAQNLLFLLGGAALVALMSQVLVWLLRLLETAESARDTEYGLAVATERLRVARELHDVLGHRLGIIALKAELAADLTQRDPDAARAESAAIRDLASTTVREVRRALLGDTTTDLATQLRSARLVLTSAGLDVRGDVETAGLSSEESRALAAVLREAVTNLLRHSNARVVTISMAAGPGPRTLVVVNDGVAAASTGRLASSGSDRGEGTGLVNLAARTAASGVRLRWGPVGDDAFEVRGELAG